MLVRLRYKERKISLMLISAIKTIDFCVKYFHLIKGVHIKLFFYLENALRNKSEVRKIFQYRFDFGFWGWFFEAIDRFIIVSMLFF